MKRSSAAFLAALPLLLGGVSRASDAPAEASASDAGARAEAEAIPEEISALYDAAHFARCAASPGVVLNEVCAVGTECDPDVRVADFVEIYNPGSAEVDLRCFALRNVEGTLFLPRTLLPAGGIEAWGEGALTFRLRKAGDEVYLLQLGIEDGEPHLALRESVSIDAMRAHRFRSPDGGPWVTLGIDAAEAGFPGSYGLSNVAADESDEEQQP